MQLSYPCHVARLIHTTPSALPMFVLLLCWWCVQLFPEPEDDEEEEEEEEDVGADEDMGEGDEEGSAAAG